MGAESGAQSVLDAMEKGTKVEQIEEAAPRLRAAGIRVAFFLQFGYPGEGPAEIEATRSLVARVAARRHRDLGVVPAARARASTRGSAPTSARSGTGSTRTTWRCSTAARSRPRFYRRLHGAVHKEFRLRRAAGTVSPATHVARALRRMTARDRLGRAKDALTLPLDNLVLAGMQRLERRPR